MFKAVILTLIFCVSPVLRAEDATEQLQQKMQEMEKQVLQLQQQLQQIPGAPRAVENTNKPADPAAMQDMQKLMDNPTVQKWLTVFKHPDFFPNIAKLKVHPRLETVGIAQLALFLLMILFRAWRQSKATNWFARVWISIYVAAIFWSCSLYFLPIYLLGEPYKKICDLLWKTFT